MHFHYVDIGTSDFQTSLDERTKIENILLVEPLKFYLDNLPTDKRIYKENSACSDKDGEAKMFFVDPKTIIKKKLPFCVRGQNKLNKPHNSVPNEYQITETVKTCTFDTLLKKYEVTSIGRLKIDTEGCEPIILTQVIEKIKQGLKIECIQFEYTQVLENMTTLDKLILEFSQLGYKNPKLVGADYVLKLKEEKDADE